MPTYLEDEIGNVPMPAPAAKEGVKADFWCKELPTMNEQGRAISGGMWEPQRQWWDLPNFIKILVGGYGSGKTMILCKRMISLALENAPCPVAIVSPTFPQARETSIVTCKTLLDGKRQLLGKEFRWTYNASTHQFTIFYKGRVARIIIYSGDNPLALKGPNLAAAGIDEPFIQDEAVYKQLLARIRHPLAKKRELCVSGTPEKLGWGWGLCMGEEGEGQDVGFIRASTRQNKALPSDYVKRLEASYSIAEAEAYLDGHFRNLTSGQVYHAFDAARNVKKLDAPRDAQFAIGMDFNVNPFAFTLFWYTLDQIHYFDEYELPNADTEYACRTIRTRPDGHRFMEVFPDASGGSRHTSSTGGRSDFTYLKAAGFELRHKGANPFVKDRENAVNGALRASDGTSKMTIDPRCKKLIRYLSQYNHSEKNKQKSMGHLLDAVGYPVAHIFPVDKQTVTQMRLAGT